MVESLSDHGHSHDHHDHEHGHDGALCRHARERAAEAGEALARAEAICRGAPAAPHPDAACRCSGRSMTRTSLSALMKSSTFLARRRARRSRRSRSIAPSDFLDRAGVRASPCQPQRLHRLPARATARRISSLS